MNLEEYIAEKGLKKIFVADKIGISRSYLSKILSGVYAPSRELSMKIEAFTDGKVTKEESIFPDKYKSEGE